MATPQQAYAQECMYVPSIITTEYTDANISFDEACMDRKWIHHIIGKLVTAIDHCVEGQIMLPSRQSNQCE